MVYPCTLLQRLKPERYQLYRRSKDLLHPAADTVNLKKEQLFCRLLLLLALCPILTQYFA
jgi:hypothetical protein